MLRGESPQRLWQKALTDGGRPLCHIQRCCAGGQWTRWHSRLQGIRGTEEEKCYLRRIPKQIPENLSRKGCAPIIGQPRGVTWSAYIFVVFYSGDHSYADPQTALSP